MRFASAPTERRSSTNGSNEPFVPQSEMIQSDGRIKRWAQIPEAENRYLRVVLLEDGETVHNFSFDRRFVP